MWGIQSCALLVGNGLGWGRVACALVYVAPVANRAIEAGRPSEGNPTVPKAVGSGVGVGQRGFNMAEG